MCPICKHNILDKYLIHDKMFIVNKVYEYFECINCGVLFRGKDKINSDHYDNETYYSFKSNTYQKKNRFKEYIDKKRYNHEVLGESLLGNIFCKFKPCRSSHLSWIKQLNFTSFHQKVIDVGCGNGQILDFLSSIGFVDLIGIDPYIKNEIVLNNYAIRKKTIFDIIDKYEIVMFHHVFEHMNNPIEVLLKTKKILKKGGKILIRIPFKDSVAWELYRENWVQIDAPRHSFLYTSKSLEILFSEVGLKIINLTFDSSAFQFWGSIQYIEDIPLFSEKSFAINPDKSIFRNEEIQEFEQRSIEYNALKKGDQVSIVLGLDE